MGQTLAHLNVQRWQVEQIQQSLGQADEGKLDAHAKVKHAARKWQRRRARYVAWTEQLSWRQHRLADDR